MTVSNNNSQRMSNYQAIRNRRRRETIFGNQIRPFTSVSSMPLNLSDNLNSRSPIEIYSDSEEEERRIDGNISQLSVTIANLRGVMRKLYEAKESIRRRRSVRAALLEERRRQLEYGLPSYREATQNDFLPSYNEVRRNQENVVNNTVLNEVNNNNNNDDDSDDSLGLPSADELLERVIREHGNNSGNNSNNPTTVRSNYFNK